MNKTLLPNVMSPTASAKPVPRPSDDRHQVRAEVERLIEESAFYAAFADLDDSRPQTFLAPEIDFSFD